MLRETPNNESIIVEYGFADATGDDVNLLKNNWKELTEAVIRALADYIGVPYKLPSDMAGIESNYYIVKKGDTLYSIARTYGVPVNELKTLNNLTNNNLSVGMTLKIPSIEEPSGTSIYTVKKGDTLYKIAGLYNMTVNELKALNNLTSNSLSIGQQLKVVSDDNSVDTANTYIVKAGDSLYSIAKQFQVTVNALKQANNKTSNLLTIGEKLIIPASSSSSNTYTVKAGDTLYQIARRYGLSVDALKQANNLTSNLLTIGSNLIIP